MVGFDHGTWWRVLERAEARTLHERSDQVEHREGAQRNADGEGEREDVTLARHHGVHRLVVGIGRLPGRELLLGANDLRVAAAGPPAERQACASRGVRDGGRYGVGGGGCARG